MSYQKFMTIRDYQVAYSSGSLSLEKTVQNFLDRAREPDPAWIFRFGPQELAAQINFIRQLAKEKSLEELPLFGVPFAVKDNIDVAGIPTTAACPEFTYTPEHDATVVERLRKAGALLVGKTNLDQFATGLSGTRSPFGPVPNAFNPNYISGGSSSGSAVSVATLQVAFALGTDTAGSGRVPAGFNNLVGLKPTRGLSSCQGVVPACRSLDCVSVFALDVADAATVLSIIEAYDPQDIYSRPRPETHRFIPQNIRLAIPDQLEFLGDGAAGTAFAEALARLMKVLGLSETIRFDLDLAKRMSDLLYTGPWVAEREAAFGDFARSHPQAIHPVVAQIIAKAAQFNASDAFKAEYTRRSLQGSLNTIWDKADILVVPTTPTIYTLKEILANPIQLNTNLGLYTNFVNLSDWSALSLPGGFRADGLAHGITLIAPAWHEELLLSVGLRLQNAFPWNLGISARPAVTAPLAPRSPSGQNDQVKVAVVGAHLSGQALNYQLTQRGGQLIGAAKTAPRYRLVALPNTTPAKPGLLRQESQGGGYAIDLEIWQLPTQEYGSFVSLIPSPLCLGSIELADGTWVQGFLAEAWACQGATDISRFGGWKGYLEDLETRK